MLEKLPESVGRVLKGVRPGLDKIVAAKEEIADAPDTHPPGEPRLRRRRADAGALHRRR